MSQLKQPNDLKNTDSKYIMSTVETALEILEAISDFSDTFSLSELSDKVGISKSQTYRYIETLKKRGYISKTNINQRYKSKYKVGLSAYETSCKLISRMDLYTKAKPIMEELAREIHETVYLVILKGENTLYLDKVETDRKVSTLSFVGRQFPLEDSAAGKVISANTGLDQELTGDLARIKEQGYSIDIDILDHGVSSVAAPILDATRKSIASLCVVAPTFRLTSTILNNNDLIEKLCIASSRISYSIGFRSNDVLRHYDTTSPFIIYSSNKQANS